MGGFLRWARVRQLVEGKLQRGRVEGYANEASDAIPRPQDYGFAGNPVAGQALYLEINGQPAILRLDMLDKRPTLADLEVAFWHAEGHMVRLKAGGLVEATCTRFVVNASEGVEFNTPTVAMNADATVGGALAAVGDVTAGGKSLTGHQHPNIARGGEVSDPPQ